MAWVTDGVVTPNMVRPMAGLLSVSSGRPASAIAAMAMAALRRIPRLMRFSPRDASSLLLSAGLASRRALEKRTAIRSGSD